MKLFQKWKSERLSPQNIVLLFVFVMLVPNLVLAITEPYGFTTIAALFLIPAGIYLLWMTISKRTGLMLLLGLPLLILAAFQLVISYLFGNSIIAVDMFTNLFTTNASEAGELLGTIYPSVIFVCVLYIPLLVIGVYCCVKKIRISGVQRKRFAFAGLLSLLLGIGMAGVSHCRNSEFSVKYHIFPINVCYNIGLSVEQWNKSLNYPKTSENFMFNAIRPVVADAQEVYVLVIGEASRACSWNLFGYDRETNPRLSRIKNLIPFEDMLTQCNATHKSVPLMLSPVSAENYEDIYKTKSLPVLFSEAGFRTVFISNQPTNRSLIDFFSGQADTLIDITSHKEQLLVEYHLDEEIIPHVRSQIEKTEEDLLIIIHTYGSHASYFKRYPRTHADFVPDEYNSVGKKHREKIINAYDNTIVYTDYVLSEIIAVLEESECRTALFYCSDHGEDLIDDDRMRYLHASPTLTYYQLHIAGFAWFSDNYIKTYPEKYEAACENRYAAASTSSVFHTMGDMASIQCDHLIRERSLLSKKWKDKKRMYLNDHNHAVHFLNTGVMDYDVSEFEKHRIKFDKRDIQQIRY